MELPFSMRVLRPFDIGMSARSGLASVMSAILNGSVDVPTWALGGVRSIFKIPREGGDLPAETSASTSPASAMFCGWRSPL